MKSLYKGIKGLIFPEPLHCMLCHRPSRSIENIGVCQSCLDRLPFIKKPTCNVCGKPLRLESKDAFLCNTCDTKKSNFYKKAMSVALYEGAMRHWICKLKYQRDVSLAQPFGALMAMRLEEERDLLRLIQGVVPVPLNQKREAERGFNQSYLLAQVICSFTGKPLLGSCVKRIRDTPFQKNLAQRERKTNLRGAFQVTFPSQIAEKRLLLVDDVYTTGATVNECSRALLRSGALEIYVITLAIGVQDLDWRG